MSGGLTPKSRAVLTLIANGFSYSQIVDGHPELTYMDIFEAAREALTVADDRPDYAARLAAIREEHPRAYEPWETEEEDSLQGLFADGCTVTEIAYRLQRQPTAIEARLRKLGLDPEQRARVYE